MSKYKKIINASEAIQDDEDIPNSPLFKTLLEQRNYSDNEATINNLLKGRYFKKSNEEKVAFLSKLVSDLEASRNALVLSFWRINYKEALIKWIQKEIKRYSPTKREVKYRAFIFNPNIKESQVKDLYNAINGELISDISFEKFKQIFDNRPIDGIAEQLRWLLTSPNDKTKPNLRWLFKFLYSLKSIGILDPSNFNAVRNSDNIYRKVENCFVDFKGRNFKKSTSYNDGVAYTNDELNGFPKLRDFLKKNKFVPYRKGVSKT